MKAVTLCLLVLASASCLLGAHATTDVESMDVDELRMELEVLQAQLEDGDFVQIEGFGFCGAVYGALKAVVKGVEGINCVLKEVERILDTTTTYVDDVLTCTKNMPKDMVNIVNSCKKILGLCNNVIHTKSQLCTSTDSTGQTTVSTKKCTINVIKTTMSVARQINRTLKLMAKLPSDTSSCYMTATNEIKASYNQFLPNIKAC